MIKHNWNFYNPVSKHWSHSTIGFSEKIPNILFAFLDGGPSLGQQCRWILFEIQSFALCSCVLYSGLLNRIQLGWHCLMISVIGTFIIKCQNTGSTLFKSSRPRCSTSIRMYQLWIFPCKINSRNLSFPVEKSGTERERGIETLKYQFRIPTGFFTGNVSEVRRQIPEPISLQVKLLEVVQLVDVLAYPD